MSTSPRVPTYHVNLGITGRKAIEAVRLDLAGDGVSLTLHKFADATGEAEDDLDLERAEEIHRVDPGLVYLGAEIVFFSGRGGLWALCGKLHVLLGRGGIVRRWLPEEGPGAATVAVSEKNIDEMIAAGFALSAPAALGEELKVAAHIAAIAITTHVRDAVEAASC